MIITQSDRNFYNEHKNKYTHIISIVCPDEKELLYPNDRNHYIPVMWDVDRVLENKFRRYDPPDTFTIMRAIRWIFDRWYCSVQDNQDFRLLVHCDAGISRSSALTLGILWYFSESIFNKDPYDVLLKPYIEARKEWCRNQVDDVNSVGLCRFIDGRYNPGVKPNQAILQILREQLTYFPW